MYSSRRIFLAVCLSHCRPGRNLEQYMYTVLVYISTCTGIYCTCGLQIKIDSGVQYRQGDNVQKVIQCVSSDCTVASLKGCPNYISSSLLVRVLLQYEPVYCTCTVRTYIRTRTRTSTFNILVLSVE